MAYNILIVDDSQTMRAVLTKTIDMAGIEIGKLFEAANGKEALEMLEKEWIDIVFADINMPVMNGIEMVDSMGKLGYMDTTPVVIISTEGSKTRLDSMREKGVRGFLRKPISPELFKNVVDGVLMGVAEQKANAEAAAAAAAAGAEAGAGAVAEAKPAEGPDAVPEAKPDEVR